MIQPVKTIIEHIKFRMIPEETFLRLKFKYKLGYKLNLAHPKRLNEKIQWLKLNDRNPLNAQCADKYAVRRYIEDKLGSRYLIPLVMHTTNPAEIVGENLPDYPIIIKTNHISGGEIIVTRKSDIDWEQAQKSMAELLAHNHYHRTKERQYKDIVPQIIVEKLLQDEDGGIPNDYKLHCFNGKLVFTHVDIDRHTDHKRNLYDADWSFLDCKWIYENGPPINKPHKYAEMKSLAEQLAEDFQYVRVDFYSLGEQIFFGELTFHPESGFGRFYPFEWDLRFGEALDIGN